MTEFDTVALPAGTRLQNYVIERVLGQGGFGITYLAHDEALNQRVAIKEFFPASITARNAATSAVHAQGDSARDVFSWGLQRFLEEARILARLSHPNIVRVLYFMPLNNTGYMVMEYEEGDPLDVWAERFAQGRMPQADIATLLAPITDALSTVHALGIAHRDVKPENIFIRADGSPVLLDFGAARNTVSGQSKTLAAIVSAGYSPIEQYSDVAEQGPWTDIYATAGVAYRLVTGETPPDAPARIEAQHAGRPDPCRTLADEKHPSFDRSFLAAIDRGLALAAGARPQSVDEWRALLFGGGAEAAGTRARGGAARRPDRAARGSQPPGEAAPRSQQSRFGLGWVLAAVVVLGLAGAGGYYLYDQNRARDLIGNTPETAYNAGIITGATERIRETVGGGDVRDLVRLRLDGPAELTLDRSGAPEAVTFNLSGPDRAFGSGLDDGDARVWRLAAGDYMLDIRSDATLPQSYEIALSAKSVDPAAIDRGRSAETAIAIDSDAMFTVPPVVVRGEIFARGDERFHLIVLREPARLTVALESAPAGAALSLTDANGLSVGEPVRGRGDLTARLQPGRYFAVVTSRDAAALRYNFAVSAEPLEAEDAPRAVDAVVADGASFARAKPLGVLPADDTRALEITLPADAQEVYGALRLTEAGVVRLGAAARAALARLGAFDQQSRARVARLDLASDAGGLALDAGAYVLRFERSGGGAGAVPIALSFAEPTRGLIDLGQVAAQTISRTVTVDQRRDGSGGPQLSFTLAAREFLSLVVGGVGGGGVPAMMRVTVDDAARRRSRTFDVTTGGVLTDRLPLEPGNYTLALGWSQPGSGDGLGDGAGGEVVVALSSLGPVPDDAHAGETSAATPLALDDQGTARIDGHVGADDARDTFRIVLARPGRLALTLSGLQSNADMQLLSAAQEAIAASRISGVKDERISRDLAAGGYDVLVDGRDPWLTPYALSVSFTPAPEPAPSLEHEQKPRPDQPPLEAANDADPPGNVPGDAPEGVVARKDAGVIGGPEADMAPAEPDDASAAATAVAPRRARDVSVEVTETATDATDRTRAIRTARRRARANVVASALSALGGIEPKRRGDAGFGFLARGVPHSERWDIAWQGDEVRVALTARVRELPSEPLMGGALSADAVTALEPFDLTVSAERMATAGVFAWGADASIVRLYPLEPSDPPLAVSPGAAQRFSEFAKRKLLSAPLPGAEASREAIVLVGCAEPEADFFSLAPVAGEGDVDQTTANAVPLDNFLERLAGFCSDSDNALGVRVLEYVVRAQ